MIRLIVALDNQNGIAKHGEQPWELPTDRKYFLDQTRRFGGNVLMGSKTLQVIGRPLKNRRNFVVSHHQPSGPGVEWVPELISFLEIFPEDIWVIGGAGIYEQTIDMASELYVTEIDKSYGCDQFFPHYDSGFHLQGPRTEIRENGAAYQFCVYQRNS